MRKELADSERTAVFRAATSGGAPRFANTAGAIVAGRLACSDAMPTAAEVTARLGDEPEDRNA